MLEVTVNALVYALTTTALGAVVIFLARNLILERLKNSVKHEYDKRLKEFELNLNRSLQREMAEFNSQLALKTDSIKSKTNLYSTKQIDIYIALWESLHDLKYSMLKLWVQAAKKEFDDFAKKLEKTTMLVERSALVIEEHHYIELIEILNDFSRFEDGKRTLIDYRESNRLMPYNDHAVRRLIDENRETKNQLLSYLPQMRDCLRKQINGKPVDDEHPAITKE